MRIDSHPAATKEFEKSIEWYQARSQIAAQRFAIAVDEAVAKIAADPVRFLRLDLRHRACTVVGFPFQIVFRVDDARIYIVAIAHAKRRPNYWRSRR